MIQPVLVFLDFDLKDIIVTAAVNPANTVSVYETASLFTDAIKPPASLDDEWLVLRLGL